jgi:PadR family transcriptional regulator, regulatory protein PadR
MGTESPRLSGPTLRVLGQFLDNPLSGLSGADIAKQTALASGTLYPILMRLESAKWLKSKWETIDPTEEGRPRKRIYEMTSLGATRSRAAFASLIPASGRLQWQS